MGDKHHLSAVKHGYIGARQWADIRKAHRFAKKDGATFIVHGVTVIGGTADKENHVQPFKSSTEMPARGTRSSQPTEAVGSARDVSKKQQRNAQRLEEYQAMRVGLRWLPLAQCLLRRSRAIVRDTVWTGRMREKLAIREKTRALIMRAWTHAQQHAHVRPPPDPAPLTEEQDVFGPESFSDDDSLAAEEDRQMQEAIARSLATTTADTSYSDETDFSPNEFVDEDGFSTVIPTSDDHSVSHADGRPSTAKKGKKGRGSRGSKRR